MRHATRTIVCLGLNLVKQAMGLGLLLSALSSQLTAQAAPTPEIDPSLATSAAALLAGGLLLLAGRRRRE